MYVLSLSTNPIHTFAGLSVFAKRESEDIELMMQEKDAVDELALGLSTKSQLQLKAMASPREGDNSTTAENLFKSNREMRDLKGIVRIETKGEDRSGRASGDQFLAGFCRSRQRPRGCVRECIAPLEWPPAQKTNRCNEPKESVLRLRPQICTYLPSMGSVKSALLFLDSSGFATASTSMLRG